MTLKAPRPAVSPLSSLSHVLSVFYAGCAKQATKLLAAGHPEATDSMHIDKVQNIELIEQVLRRHGQSISPSMLHQLAARFCTQKFIYLLEACPTLDIQDLTHHRTSQVLGGQTNTMLCSYEDFLLFMKLSSPTYTYKDFLHEHTLHEIGKMLSWFGISQGHDDLADPSTSPSPRMKRIQNCTAFIRHFHVHNITACNAILDASSLVESRPTFIDLPPDTFQELLSRFGGDNLALFMDPDTIYTLVEEHEFFLSLPCLHSLTGQPYGLADTDKFIQAVKRGKRSNAQIEWFLRHFRITSWEELFQRNNCAHPDTFKFMSSFSGETLSALQINMNTEELFENIPTRYDHPFLSSSFELENPLYKYCTTVRRTPNPDNQRNITYFMSTYYSGGPSALSGKHPILLHRVINNFSIHLDHELFCVLCDRYMTEFQTKNEHAKDAEHTARSLEPEFEDYQNASPLTVSLLRQLGYTSEDFLHGSPALWAIIKLHVGAFKAMLERLKITTKAAFVAEIESKRDTFAKGNVFSLLQTNPKILGIFNTAYPDAVFSDYVACGELLYHIGYHTLTFYLETCSKHLSLEQLKDQSDLLSSKNISVFARSTFLGSYFWKVTCGYGAGLTKNEYEKLIQYLTFIDEEENITYICNSQSISSVEELVSAERLVDEFTITATDKHPHISGYHQDLLDSGISADTRHKACFLYMRKEELRKGFGKEATVAYIEEMFAGHNVSSKNALCAVLDQRITGYLAGTISLQSDEIAVLALSRKADLATLPHIQSRIQFLSFLIENRGSPWFATLQQHHAFLQKFIEQNASFEFFSTIYRCSHGIASLSPSLLIALWEKADSLAQHGGNLQQAKFLCKEIFPLYMIEATFANEQHTDPYTRSPFSRYLVDIRQRIQNPESDLGTEKARIFSNIQGLFQKKFGITKVPESFTEEDMVLIQTYTRYSVYMNHKTPYKDSVLGFFLALQLNGDWAAFRAGQEFDSNDYMTPEKSLDVSTYMKNRASYDILGDQTPEALQILQQTEHNHMEGQVIDLDIELGNMSTAFEQLVDPDLYTIPEQRCLLQLVLSKTYTTKEIGKMLASAYQHLQKQIPFSSELQHFLDTLATTTGISTTTWTCDRIQTLQRDLKPLVSVVHALNKVESLEITALLEESRQASYPSTEIITIFEKLGEKLSSQSGVSISYGDIIYFKKILGEKSTLLTQSEREKATAYLAKVLAYLDTLAARKQEVHTLFSHLKHTLDDSSYDALKGRAAELATSVFSVSTATKDNKVIVSTLTTRPHVMFSNIRACLSCKNTAINNDTNLSIGDANKFFLLSHSGNELESFSDQLVTLLPTSSGRMFVMDIMYGETTPDILLGHILVIAKKIARLPKTSDPFKIFVSQAALDSCHLTREYADAKLAEVDMSFAITSSSVEVTTTQSAAGDNYHEFFKTDTDIGHPRSVQTGTIAGREISL